MADGNYRYFVMYVDREWIDENGRRMIAGRIATMKP
jgi:hypothetical protein